MPRGMLFPRCAVLLTVGLAACHDGHQPPAGEVTDAPPGEDASAASDASLDGEAAPVLPGGKQHFSVAFARFSTSGAVWVRVGRWTLDPAHSAVAATFWQWDSAAEYGKAAVNAHTCTQSGTTGTCTVFAPAGWIAGQGNRFDWSGTYALAGNVVSIDWSNGERESWTVTSPDPAVARVVLRSSTYGQTHGRGYGSNASWTTFTPVTQIPRKQYRGIRAAAVNAGGATTVTNYTTDALDLTSFTSSANGLAMHALLSASPSVCHAGCATSRTGIVYHLGSTNAGRALVYNHFCACLSTTWPCYAGNLHPYAFDEIVDDAGKVRGFVGIEQQDEPGSAGFQYQIKDLTDVPQ